MNKVRMFRDLAPLTQTATLRAFQATYDGRMTEENLALMRASSYLYSINPEVSARILYTRDAGHHSAGWWRNPDYERCLHLSVSFCVNPTDETLPFMRVEAEKIARAFWRDDARLAWVERPYSPEGLRAEVHHYRLFCDPSWRPILPRGEVYTRQFTEVGWKSFTEIHGDIDMRTIDAPFLLNQ